MENFVAAHPSENLVKQHLHRFPRCLISSLVVPEILYAVVIRVGIGESMSGTVMTVKGKSRPGIIHSRFERLNPFGWNKSVVITMLY